MPTRSRFPIIALIVLCSSLTGRAQDAPDTQLRATTTQSGPGNSSFGPMDTTKEKWQHFVHETSSPLVAAAVAFDATFSQITQTDPKYGVNRIAYAKRFGASAADIVTQNFFGDFVIASAFHEDSRYFRKGSGHSLLYRIGYSISRAVVIRKDTGGNTFNFDNVLGSAMSAGFSNIYYPPASRTGRAILMHFWIDVADNGFVNLGPEFWPDFRRKILRRHH
ncbi:MAG TPA: hypothetical protein VGG14_05160 [Candidatus Sulfotelmatobacter sp.]|jgi:hypothetical protein